MLKEIRRQIAEANDIAYVVEECKYKGDCLGTCPKCEAEVRYLEEQLQQRQLLGKAVMVAGLSAGLLSMASCGNGGGNRDSGDKLLYGTPKDSTEICPVKPYTDHTMGESPLPVRSKDSLREPERKVIDEEKVEKAVDDENHKRDKKEKSEIKEKPQLVASPEKTEKAAIPSNEEKPQAAKVKEDAISADDSNTLPFFGEIVSQMPSFPGGNGALMKYLKENVKYPDQCVNEKIEGRVIVGFVVNEDGSISDVEIKKSANPMLDKEALRVVSAMPKWVPGEENGKPVKTSYNIPITFKL